MNAVINEISELGIVPVVVINSAEDAVLLAEALIRGGLPCAEVTFRTAAAEEAVRKIAENYPGMLLGAGTVLTIEQLDRAVAAGADFVVSPGLNPKIVKYCIDKNIPIIPGCANPSDVEAAIELGLDTVKFFPAEAIGGIKMLKAMSAPYGNVKFMPTGGINENNINDYLSFDKIIACGGSWMVTSELIAQNDFAEIERLTRRAVKKMLDLKISRVEINEKSGAAATEAAECFKRFFDGGTDILDFINSEQILEKGTIEVSASSVKRAVYHLRKNGVEFENGVTGELAYLKNSFGGFKVRIVKAAEKK